MPYQKVPAKLNSREPKETYPAIFNINSAT